MEYRHNIQEVNLNKGIKIKDSINIKPGQFFVKLKFVCYSNTTQNRKWNNYYINLSLIPKKERYISPNYKANIKFIAKEVVVTKWQAGVIKVKVAVLVWCYS